MKLAEKCSFPIPTKVSNFKRNFRQFTTYFLSSSLTSSFIAFAFASSFTLKVNFTSASISEFFRQIRDKQLLCSSRISDFSILFIFFVKLSWKVTNVKPQFANVTILLVSSNFDASFNGFGRRLFRWLWDYLSHSLFQFC